MKHAPKELRSTACLQRARATRWKPMRCPARRSSPPPCPRLDCLPGPYAKCPRCAAKSARWAWFWSKPRGKLQRLVFLWEGRPGRVYSCIPAITSTIGREMTACDCLAGRAMTACDWLATGHRMACVLSRQSA